MQIEKLSDNWLFERHSKQTIREWLGQLRYYYFKRAWGGHANDGDEFQAAFAFTDRQDLQYKIGQWNCNSILEIFFRQIFFLRCINLDSFWMQIMRLSFCLLSFSQLLRESNNLMRNGFFFCCTKPLCIQISPSMPAPLF